MRILRSGTVSLLFVLALASTGGPALPAEEAAEFPLRIEDSYGRTVRLDRPPERIVSLAPGVTETLFAIGKGGAVVGRTEFCDYPEVAASIPVAGSLERPNAELTVALRPDLVIASTHFGKDALASLERAGLTVAVVYGRESFEGAYETIRMIGMLAGARQEAEAVVARMEEKVRDVRSRVADAPRPSVYYVIGFGEQGEWTAGGDTFVGEMIEMAGGRNIAADVSGWAFSLEKIVERNPRIVLCSSRPGVSNAIRTANGYRDLPAIRAGRLRPIDNDGIDRQGPWLAEGLETLARAIHPERFGE